MSIPSSPDILVENLLSDGDHKSLDVKIISIMKQSGLREELTDAAETFRLITVVQHILEQAPWTANLRTLSDEEILMILINPQVYEIVQKGVQYGTFRNVCNLAALRVPPVISPDVDTSTVARGDDMGRSATMLSWKSPFIGEAHKLVYQMMSSACSDRDEGLYARSSAVVQSSGMGKSRMIDELSKEHFVIPINLRTGTGFPPGDSVVTEFLVRTPFTANDAFRRAQAFLISLFETTAKVIPHLNVVLRDIMSEMPPADYPTSAEKFRLFMTYGQSYEQPGQLRQKFYRKVINRAEQILKLLFKASTRDIESKGIVPMDTDDERKSDMNTAQDRKIEPNSSPVINFIEEGRALNLYQSAFRLIMVVAPHMPTSVRLLQSKPPQIILAYDEAHALSFPKNESKPRGATAYSEHRRVIRELRTLPIFALFLSTTGMDHDLPPPPAYNSSDRLLNLPLRLLPPFSALGFDQMARAHAGENFGINDVSKVEFMVLFGRPLWGSRYKNGSSVDKLDIAEFATQKLMHALMSVRLALEFNARTAEGRAREMEQVEKYMRVCILVHEGFETAVTISPSEPLLAEAARQYMTNPKWGFNMPASLLEHLTTMGLNKGDRGSLAAQVILILAADKACKEHLATEDNRRSMPTGGFQHQSILDDSTVPRAFSVELFIKALLEEHWHGDVLCSLPARWLTTTESNREFRTAFKDTRIYFTHFIKLNDPKVVNREFLWKMVKRGCVALCADGQNSINIIVPLVFGTETLCRSNVSALFVQVKNNRAFTAQPDTSLFDLMNPYLVRFFDTNEEEPLPIIRMVFVLGSPTAAVKVIPQYEKRLPHKAKTATQEAVQRSCRYTSYDIWCAKASSETFGVIEPRDEWNYSLLLKTGKVFPEAYYFKFGSEGIEGIENVRRSMNPATSAEGAHWESFANTTQPPALDLGDNVDFGDEVMDE